jgi:hypothetical protein
VPAVFEALARCDGYLAIVWPQLAPSVETAGFRDSALYLADMALEAVAAELEPALTREALRVAGLGAHALEAVVATLDVFQWVTPQTLLLCAALAEAAEQPRIGGEGRPEPRATVPRETAHLAMPIVLAPLDTPPLPAIALALQLAEAPELYRALAALPDGTGPAYLALAWAETQHVAVFPALRRRGRALYYYARSAARFLAQPLAADAAALAVAGLAPEAFVTARAVLAEALPATATMLIHCAALRVGLGLTGREEARARNCSLVRRAGAAGGYN